jgi:hypothetical protein
VIDDVFRNMLANDTKEDGLSKILHGVEPWFPKSKIFGIFEANEKGWKKTIVSRVQNEEIKSWSWAIRYYTQTFHNHVVTLIAVQFWPWQ